uniref:RIKEN cDNA A530084C06 gene n=1 Tax=Cricetulus griseus TaxID=10029 RepID=A0A8C2LZJ1_CRIGR
GAWGAACTVCCARPRRCLRCPRTALPRRSALCRRPPRNRPGNWARHRSSSRRHRPPDPPRRRPPLGCWPHSPRQSLRSRHQPPTAEMARRCCRLPPGHCPSCPRGRRVGRTLLVSCRRWCSRSGAVPFSCEVVGSEWREAGFSREGPLLPLPERRTFPWTGPLPLECFSGGVMRAG